VVASIRVSSKSLSSRELVYDLLPKWLFLRLAKSALPKGHLAHNLDGLCLKVTLGLWVSLTLLWGHHYDRALPVRSLVVKAPN